jgi:hypothetical protein
MYSTRFWQWQIRQHLENRDPAEAKHEMPIGLTKRSAPHNVEKKIITSGR